jgi:hypothetical protein
LIVEDGLAPAIGAVSDASTAAATMIAAAGEILRIPGTGRSIARCSELHASRVIGRQGAAVA